jgi:putative ATP-binding cassette transporter
MPALKPTLQGRALARALWRLIRIYWTSPDAKWGALLLGGAVALQLGGVYVNVLVAFGQRHVGDALGARDATAFSRSLGFLGFAMVLSVAVPVYSEWVQQLLRVRWRRWLTKYYLERWIGPQAYCQADLRGAQLDNPDVRIAEDVRDFVASALGLSLTLLQAIVTLVSFAAVLWTLSSAWAIPILGETRRIPGLMLWVAVVFAVLSMWITQVVGRRLIPLNFEKIHLEADFRYGLVRYRDHVEAVALMRGEAVERLGAVGRFQRVVENFHDLVRGQRNLGLLTQGIGAANDLIPLGLAAVAYFADVLTLGVIAETRFAYGQVAGGLAWFVNAYQEIARWRANIERLSSFSDAIDATQRDFEGGGIRIERAEPDAIRLAGLGVEAPRGRPLLQGASATVAAGERVAITGRQGSGRTMLMRALAGIWPFGSGRIAQPPRERMFFLSQQPYLPIGSLRDVVAYPSARDAFPDERMREALRVFELDHLLTRLDDEEPWAQKLSAHEQQRLALARVLLHEPEWILLDEATSNLDEATEAKAYEILTRRLPRAALLAVAERPGVLPYLPRRWNLAADDRGRVALEAA